MGGGYSKATFSADENPCTELQENPGAQFLSTEGSDLTNPLNTSSQKYLLRKHPSNLQDSAISCTVVSIDGRDLYLGHFNGKLGKLESRTSVLKYYDSLIFTSGISCLEVTQDNSHIFGASRINELKMIDLCNGSTVYDFGVVHDSRIRCMQMTDSGLILNIGSDWGHWIAIDVMRKEKIWFDSIDGAKDINCITATKDGTFIFTVDSHRFLRQSRITEKVSCLKETRRIGQTPTIPPKNSTHSNKLLSKK
jgi:hypothetical protein